MHGNNMGDFDPYDWIVETSDFIENLSKQHNALVEDYRKTKQRISMLEKDMINLQVQLIALEHK